MRHFAFLMVLLFLALFCPGSARPQTPATGSDVGANAAMKYWQGFALQPTLDADQERLLEDWHKVPFDTAALKLIEQSESSRVYLHRGAKLARCDWSLDYQDGIRLLLPHLAKSMTLARLTALHARHEFEQSHWQAGWDDVVALLTLARRIEATPIIIGNLVGYRIESIAIEAVAPWLPEMKAALPPNASGVLDRLPAGATLHQMVLMEKEIGALWLIHELKEAEKTKRGAWQDVWNGVLSSPVEEPEHHLKDLARSATTFEQALQKLEAHLLLDDQLAKIAALPWKEFDAQYAEFITKTKTNPLAGFLLPRLDKYVTAERRCQAQMALFKGALAVVQGGPEKFKEIRDPFGDGPVEYRSLNNGFELTSKLIFKDRPVTLTAGRVAIRQ